MFDWESFNYHDAIKFQSQAQNIQNQFTERTSEHPGSARQVQKRKPLHEMRRCQALETGMQSLSNRSSCTYGLLAFFFDFFHSQSEKSQAASYNCEWIDAGVSVDSRDMNGPMTADPSNALARSQGCPLALSLA